VRPGAPFDVLVIGSGASGLAAAVSAERAGARVGLATKTTLQACNSAKAQGGIQAAFGEDDSPEIHAEDVMRSSHDTADPTLVGVLTSEARSMRTTTLDSESTPSRSTSAVVQPACAAWRSARRSRLVLP